MPTAKQVAANKKNARNSTGPTSAKGKKASSRNAIKHGLTLPPSTDSVLDWLRIITENPDATIDVMTQDIRSLAVLRLAEAEARFERALEAERTACAELAKYTRSHKELDLLKLDFKDIDDPRVLEIMFGNMDDKNMKEGIRILLASNSNHIPKLVKRVETTSRYVRQAERQKARALAAWQEARRAV